MRDIVSMCRSDLELDYVPGEVRFMSSNNTVTMNNRQFAEEKVGKLLFKFAVPAIISLLVAEMYNMVDSLFVGQTIGANGIAALTIAFPVQRLFSAMAMLVAVGASTAVARSSGAGESHKLKTIIPNAMILILGLGIVLIVGISYFIDPLIIKLGASSAIFPYAKDYISLILIGVVFQGLSMVIANIMMSLGDTKIVLMSTSIGAIINVIIDAILVLGLGYGVKGAAIATSVSQIISLVYVLVKFSGVKHALNLKFTFKLDNIIVKGIMLVGFSTFIVEISDAIVAVLLNNLLSGIGGDNAIVIVGLTTKISMFLFMTVMGISSAMQPIAAYNYGARNYKRLKEIIRKSIISVSIATIALWALFMVFTSTVVNVFISDPRVISDAAKALRIVIAVFPCIGVYYVSIYYYQAMNMVKTSFLLSIFRQIIIFIPLLYFLVNGLGLGVLGAWLAYPISDLVSSITGIIAMKKATVSLEEMEGRKAPRGSFAHVRF